MTGRRTGGAAWQRLRKVVLTRDGYRCRMCGKAGRLEIDHIKPVWTGGTDDLDNLRALCGGGPGGGCHAKRHRRERTDTEAAWDKHLAGFSDCK